MRIAIHQGRFIGTRIIGDPEGLRALAEVLEDVARQYEEEVPEGFGVESVKVTVTLGRDREADVICRVDEDDEQVPEDAINPGDLDGDHATAPESVYGPEDGGEERL